MRMQDAKGLTGRDSWRVLSQVQIHLAEMAREMASTKAELLGAHVTRCNWVGSCSTLCIMALPLSLHEGSRDVVVR